MTVRVQLPAQRNASYDILIATGLLKELGAILRRHAAAPAFAVVSDQHVAKLYGAAVVEPLRELGTVELFTFPAGESSKTRETWAALSDRMLASHFGRDCAVVALGGGVVGDVAGFVAATYLRGVRFVQIPTTLMAMIDSSIGGKTGVDVSAGKNLLGAFHQPRVVIADLALLDSLPPVQLAAGIAEAVKHGAIADRGYFEFLEANAAAILARDGAMLQRLVRRSVEIKSEVVAHDEREAGRRAILNFGHTIGHAIEATSKYTLLHGEAVAIGMVLEAQLAEQTALAAAGTAQCIAALLERFQLPVKLPPHMSAAGLIEVMRSDKKVRNAEIRIAVPKSIGTAHGRSGGDWTVGVDLDRLRDVLTP